MVKTILSILFLLLLSTGVLLIPKEILAAASIETPSNTPSEVQINQTFSFNTSLNNVQSGEIYFVKCRLGSSSSSLSDGQTYNTSSDSWLSDTNSWIDMPIVSVSDTTSNFSIQCRTKSTAITGQKVVYARACLKRSDGTCGTSFQSSSGVTMTVTDTTTPSPSPSPSTSPSFNPSPSPSLSSAFTISDIPSEIDSTQNFSASVTLSLPSAPNSAFYLKGAFKKENSSNYFGLTKVGPSWIKNGDKYSKQYSITTDSSGHWSGNLEIQADVSDAGFEGSGDYIFKVARYTDKGSGPTWSNEASININAKETQEEGETVNLSKLSPQKSPAVLGESKKSEFKKTEKIPEVVSTPSAKPSSPSAIVKSVQKKSFNLFYLFGGIFIFISGALAVYLFFKTRT